MGPCAAVNGSLILYLFRPEHLREAGAGLGCGDSSVQSPCNAWPYGRTGSRFPSAQAAATQTPRPGSFPNHRNALLPVLQGGVQYEQAGRLGSGEKPLSGSKPAPPCCVLTWQGARGLHGVSMTGLMALLTSSPPAPPMAGGGWLSWCECWRVGSHLQQRQVWPVADAAEILAGVGDTSLRS